MWKRKSTSNSLVLNQRSQLFVQFLCSNIPLHRAVPHFPFLETFSPSRKGVDFVPSQPIAITVTQYSYLLSILAQKYANTATNIKASFERYTHKQQTWIHRKPRIRTRRRCGRRIGCGWCGKTNFTGESRLISGSGIGSGNRVSTVFKVCVRQCNTP